MWKLEKLAVLAERQLADCDQERDMFDTRNYIAALVKRVQELEHLEIDYRIVKARLLALQHEVVALCTSKPFTSKQVETRGGGFPERCTTTGDDLAFHPVEDLHNPGTLGRAEFIEVPVQGECLVNCDSVEVEQGG